MPVVVDIDVVGLCIAVAMYGRSGAGPCHSSQFEPRRRRGRLAVADRRAVVVVPGAAIDARGRCRRRESCRSPRSSPGTSAAACRAARRGCSCARPRRPARLRAGCGTPASRNTHACRLSSRGSSPARANDSARRQISTSMFLSSSALRKSPTPFGLRSCVLAICARHAIDDPLIDIADVADFRVRLLQKRFGQLTAAAIGAHQGHGDPLVGRAACSWGGRLANKVAPRGKRGTPRRRTIQERATIEGARHGRLRAKAGNRRVTITLSQAPAQRTQRCRRLFQIVAHAQAGKARLPPGLGRGGCTWAAASVSAN